MPLNTDQIKLKNSTSFKDYLLLFIFCPFGLVIASLLLITYWPFGLIKKSSRKDVKSGLKTIYERKLDKVLGLCNKRLWDESDWGKHMYESDDENPDDKTLLKINPIHLAQKLHNKSLVLTSAILTYILTTIIIAICLPIYMCYWLGIIYLYSPLYYLYLLITCRLDQGLKLPDHFPNLFDDEQSFSVDV